MKIEKQLTTSETKSFPLLARDGGYGVLQSHLAQLLDFNSHGFSILITGMKVDVAKLSREEAKVLKVSGIINCHSRGGNFLPLKTIVAILEVVQSEESEMIR